MRVKQVQLEWTEYAPKPGTERTAEHRVQPDFSHVSGIGKRKIYSYEDTQLLTGKAVGVYLRAMNDAQHHYTWEAVGPLGKVLASGSATSRNAAKVNAEAWYQSATPEQILRLSHNSWTESKLLFEDGTIIENPLPSVVSIGSAIYAIDGTYILSVEDDRVARAIVANAHYVSAACALPGGKASFCDVLLESILTEMWRERRGLPVDVGVVKIATAWIEETPSNGLLKSLYQGWVESTK